MELRIGRDAGTVSVAVKCVDINWNTKGEGKHLNFSWRWGTKARVAKQIRYLCSPSRKRCPLTLASLLAGVQANALSGPPGEYGRKAKTQRNWRGPAQLVERVV